MLVLDKLYVFQWDTPISPLFMVMISFATKIMSLYTSISIIDNQTYLTMLFKMGTFQRHRKSLEWWPFHSGTLFCEDLVIFSLDGKHHCCWNLHSSALPLWAHLGSEGLSSHHGKPEQLILKQCIIYSKAERGSSTVSLLYFIAGQGDLLSSNPSSVTPDRKK